MQRYLKEIRLQTERALAKFYYEDGEYDFPYAISLVVHAQKQGLCRTDYAKSVCDSLRRLNSEYENGSEKALHSMLGCMAEFLCRVRPYHYEAL